MILHHSLAAVREQETGNLGFCLEILKTHHTSIGMGVNKEYCQKQLTLQRLTAPDARGPNLFCLAL